MNVHIVHCFFKIAIKVNPIKHHFAKVQNQFYGHTGGNHLNVSIIIIYIHNAGNVSSTIIYFRLNWAVIENERTNLEIFYRDDLPTSSCFLFLSEIIKSPWILRIKYGRLNRTCGIYIHSDIILLFKCLLNQRNIEFKFQTLHCSKW